MVGGGGLKLGVSDGGGELKLGVSDGGGGGLKLGVSDGGGGLVEQNLVCLIYGGGGGGEWCKTWCVWYCGGGMEQNLVCLMGGMEQNLGCLIWGGGEVEQNLGVWWGGGGGAKLGVSGGVELGVSNTGGGRWVEQNFACLMQVGGECFHVHGKGCIQQSVCLITLFSLGKHSAVGLFKHTF